jgi:hypothetical protein
VLHFDTCATRHIFKDRHLFSGGLGPCPPVVVANDVPVPAAGVGSARVPVLDEAGESYTALFDEAICCPTFAANLVSWKVLREKGFRLLEDCAGLVSPSGLVFPLVPGEVGPQFVTSKGGPRGR